MHILKYLGIGIVVLSGIAVLAALGHLRGWWIHSQTPEEISALLRPHDHVFVPEGGGRFPTLLLIHGCGGLGSNPLRLGQKARDWGYASIAVDSLAGRDYAGAWEGPLCQGEKLLGNQRAGDVLVSLHDARKQDFVDPDRLAMIGWSHGGWTLMELLAMNPPTSLPAGMLSSSGEGLAGVKGVALYYPYCGLGSFGTRWKPAIPTLFLLGAEDTLANPLPCQNAARAQRARGHPVNDHLFAGAPHGFDSIGDPAHPNSYYREGPAREAEQILRTFLDEVFR